MESCFDCKLEFHYPMNKDHFESLLQESKLCSQTSKSLTKGTNSTHLVNSDYGENRKRDCLIVADDVSCLADTSQKFASFLTVARKSKYHCVYILHTIHPEKSIWRSILPQTNILNIFPAPIPLTSVKKILEANCVCKTTGNVSINSLRLTRLFSKLANDENGENLILILDCEGFNPNGPGRFKTQAENPHLQTCYFNLADGYPRYNLLISKRVNTDVDNNEIYFNIEGIKSQANN